MAYGRGRILYRRSVLPKVARKGERVYDIVTGIPGYTERMVAYRGGWVDRSIGPDIDPKTDGIDVSNSPGKWPYGNLNPPGFPVDRGYPGAVAPSDAAAEAEEEAQQPPDPPEEPVVGAPTTYYVSPTGSDAANGSELAPWQTLQHAADEMADGESCTVMDGTYDEGMTVRTAGLTFIAESSSHIIHGTTTDIITVRDADRVVLSGLKVENAIRRGFYITGSDNVTVVDCEADACQVVGLFASNCNYLTIDGGNYSNTVEQHGIYFSTSGVHPTFRDVTCENNGRGGIQINAQGGSSAINASQGGIFDCTLNDNGQTGVAAAINILGVTDLTIDGCTLDGNLAGGISFTTAGSGKNSIRPRVMNVEITGRRGLSFKGSCIDAYMDQVTLVLTAGPCVTYDSNSLSGMTLTELYAFTPGVGHDDFRNDSTGQELSVAEWRAL